MRQMLATLVDSDRPSPPLAPPDRRTLARPPFLIQLVEPASRTASVDCFAYISQIVNVPLAN